MDMHKLFQVIRYANMANGIRIEKNRALATIAEVTHHVETVHEAREVTTHVINKEVSREDFHYVVRISKRYGPKFANRVYARYMQQRAMQAQQALEEEAVDD